MPQLQKLLQAYFGAMRHYLVCSSTVGATDFTAASDRFEELWDPLGIHSCELTETTAENGHWSSEKRD